MGLYAKGYGEIAIKKNTPEEKVQELVEFLESSENAPFECCTARSDREGKWISLYVQDSLSYRREDYEVLNDPSVLAIADNGWVELEGSDSSLWRMILQDNKWIEESGRVVYGFEQKEKQKKLIQRIVREVDEVLAKRKEPTMISIEEQMGLESTLKEVLKSVGIF